MRPLPIGINREQQMTTKTYQHNEGQLHKWGKYLELKLKDDSWADKSQSKKVPKNGPYGRHLEVASVLTGEDSVVFALEG